MDENTYNGWRGNGDRESAWATWNVVLWADNEYSIYKDRIATIPHGEAWTANDAAAFLWRWFPDGRTPDGAYLVDANMDEIASNWSAE